MEWSRVLVGVLTLFFVQASFGQVADDRYLINFTDKVNTPYSIENPEAFLSERAIQRRFTQSIPLVESDLPVDPEYIAQVAAFEGIEVIYSLKWFNSVLIRASNPNILPEIMGLPFVSGLLRSPVIFGDDNYQIDTREVSNLSRTAESYGLALNQIDMIQGRWLHEEGYRGEGMWIAVMDGGFNNAETALAFSDLFQDSRILGTKNFVDSDDAVFQRSSHGSYVLSTMAANQEEVIIGTAPAASYLLCITEDVDVERRIEESNWAVAAEYADSVGVDIINTSLGYTTFDVIEENYAYSDLDGNTTLITRASDIAASKGMLIVTSAGNQGNTNWFHIGAPADGDSVLAIGAVNPEEFSAGFSSRGPSADGRVKPNVCAQGAATVVSNLVDDVFTANGTSFSSPIIAGMSACLWQYYPEATAWQVHQAIEQSAHLFDNPNDSLGYGIPNFEIASQILAQVLSTRDSQTFGDLKVYPNPTTGDLFLSAEAIGTGPYRVSVFDIAGRVIFEESLFQDGSFISLPGVLQNQRSGLYFLSISSSEGDIATSKVIKN